jgi:ABC-type transport system involved in multi-copper enzyme maturation permease subunit
VGDLGSHFACGFYGAEGLLNRAGSVRLLVQDRRVSAIRVPWSSASFLVYLGGLILFAALGSLLVVQADDYGNGGFVGWALLVFFVTEAWALIALVNGRRVTAGLLALSAVAAWVVLLGALLEWFGWLAHTDSPFAGFHVSHLFLELSLLLAAAVTLAVFRFPLLVFPLAAGTWFFVTDLLSGGGDWSAVLSILVGLMLLSWAVAVDRGPTRPYAFWLHVVAGLTIGGGLLWLFHEGDWDWILIGLVALLYIWIGDRLARSSWVVLGAWALLQTTAHFAAKWSAEALGAFFYLFPFVLIDAFGNTSFERDTHPWAAALSFAGIAVVFILIGLLLARRRRTEIPGAELL